MAEGGFGKRHGNHSRTNDSPLCVRMSRTGTHRFLLLYVHRRVTGGVTFGLQMNYRRYYSRLQRVTDGVTEYSQYGSEAFYF
jgi:hypothetical protein